MKSKEKTQENLRIVRGRPSWPISASEVEGFLTETGGHLGPVTFDRRGKKIQPYSIAPWAEEEIDDSVPMILQVLRGDFFCLPFGGNDAPFRGERHPVHGETANARWKFESASDEDGHHSVHLSMNTKIRPGRVDKTIRLDDGQNTIYCEHVVSGMSGPMSLGHHAMINFPDEPGSGRVSTSRFVHGQVVPCLMELPENRGYSCLKPGAVFESLDQVPTLSGELTDLSRYPARRGFEDLVMLISDPEASFAWTSVTFPKSRFAWFALKDPRVLRHTIFWISNGGRHFPPWSGRHVNVMGLEEVTSYFHFGLAESARKNPLSEKGYTTAVRLNPKRPLAVRYIMGITSIPAGFDRVASIEPGGGKGQIILRSASGKRAQAAVDLDFLLAQSP
ncbi:MAG: hypothetical protein M1608_00015 [Candidatus Omnitrophica bacterium]|nr:hypothetical protein [Candidatus Omnitrophota bacterium]